MKEKIKCSVYVRHQTLNPSSYYRIIQYLKNISADFIVHDMFTDYEFKRNISNSCMAEKLIFQFILLIRVVVRAIRYIAYDTKRKDIEIVIVQRTIIPRIAFCLVDVMFRNLVKDKKLIWDFDDNIVYSREIAKSTADIYSKYATVIVVTHSFLKQTIDKEYREKTLELPTTDLDVMRSFSCDLIEKRVKSFEKDIRLIWVGTASNLSNVKMILPFLDLAAKKIKNKGKKLSLCIVCNIPLDTKCEYLTINNVNWTRDGAISEMEKAHIGIMPLTNSEYSKGKGAFKLIQCIGMGLPVLASNVGFNNEALSKECGVLISENEMWIDAIEQLSDDVDLYKKYSNGSRERFLEKFNPESNLHMWKQILSEV